MTPSQSYSFSGIVVNLCFFFLFFFVLHTLASPKLQYCRHDQRDALLEFKHEFSMNLALLEESTMEYGTAIVVISSVDDMSLWNKSSDCCSWESVECDAKGQVISLSLMDAPLNISLKPNSSLFKLQYLQTLTLFDCNLTGEIPSSLGNLSHLTNLVLADNNLVGQVPASIGNLTKLTSLSLNLNQLSGKIPVSFANLTELVRLDLSNNYFESKLPPDMSRLHNLEAFDMSGNSFFGPFPTSLFTIPSLQRVELGRNRFKGPIDFGNISFSSRLQTLKLLDNIFDGPIPESISMFLNLKELDLSNNSFTGTIPTSISHLVNLSKLVLSNNNLEGKIPSCLWRLVVMQLSHNSFTSFGKSPEVQSQMSVLGLDSNLFRGPFPHWICKLSSLEFLDLSNNSFNGSIPPCFRNSTNFIKVVILGNNNFSGILPDVFVNATNLQAFDVSHNQLHGKLPVSLSNCKAMELFNVGNNKFKDTFSYWLGSLPMLNVLILRSNQFYGLLHHLHVSVGFQKLKVVDVSHNDFTGTFPAFSFSVGVK